MEPTLHQITESEFHIHKHNLSIADSASFASTSLTDATTPFRIISWWLRKFANPAFFSYYPFCDFSKFASNLQSTSPSPHQHLQQSKLNIRLAQ